MVIYLQIAALCVLLSVARVYRLFIFVSNLFACIKWSNKTMSLEREKRNAEQKQGINQLLYMSKYPARRKTEMNM